MIFDGVLFTGSANSERVACKVELTQYEVKVEAEGVSEHSSYAKLHLSFGGSSNHLAFFESREQFGLDTARKLIFYIPKSPELFSALKDFGTAEMKELASKELRRKTLGRAVIMIVLFILIAGAVSAYLLRAKATRAAVNLVPYSLEEKLGEKLFPSAVPAYLLLSDKDLVRSLEGILEPIRLVMPEEFRNVKVFISSSTELNAFAFPGGYIVFNLGALRAAKTGLEILGVAAHELAHVTERHVVRNVIQGAGLFVVIQTLLGDLTGIIAVVVDQGGFLLSRNFSRTMEDEADQVGFERMVEAGYDPRGMAEFFELLAASQPVVQKNLEKGLEFLSTHPDTESRIKTIRESYDALAPQTKAGLRSTVDGFASFKKLLSKVKE